MKIYLKISLLLLSLFYIKFLLAVEFPIAEEVIVDKSDRELHLLKDDKIFRTFKIALGMSPVGDKKREGDFKTPEGKYILDIRNPNSEYFLSIHISYPNVEDRIEANKNSVLPGGAIMIHGQPNKPSHSEAYYKSHDWTNGCIAVSNSDMIDLWLMIREKTPIEIRP
ncbi:MAG: hypothetical protein CMQ54_05360 [Gammaproteobacteria bacterium]|nr:hypothetical protein [Gammaproteobacteria bacterium]|tara:strand:- start:583 stop:1083 length:501 start_codon:yes stop_codon:yes gene_type:complete